MSEVKTTLCRECRHRYPEEWVHRVISSSSRRGITYYCDWCIEALGYKKCDHCDVYVPEGGMRSHNGHRYCRTCFDTLYVICNGCLGVVERALASQGRDFRPYCEDCFNERFFVCEGCGGVDWIDNRRMEDETCLCGRCFSERDRVIREYSYTPTRFNFGKFAWENTTYLGIELEVEPSGSDWETEALSLHKKMKELNVANRYYLKEDGSIQGFEIVTHPCTLQYAKKQMQFRRILNYLQEEGFTSYESGRCGLHVHIGIRNLTDFEVMKVRTFFAKCTNQIVKFSCRNSNALNYCLPETFNKPTFLGGLQDGRYHALALRAKCQTIEMRIFRGTLSYKRFMATLEFADATIGFAQNVGVAFLMGQNNDLEIWNTFKGYLRSENRYHTLEKYLSERSI